MAVIVDLYCDNKECDYTEIDAFVDTSLDDHGTCPKCKSGLLRRMVSKQMTFELKYNNKTDVCAWGNEGYSSSQFWKKIKETGGDLPEKYRDKWY